MTDADVERVGARSEVEAPDGREDECARQHLAWVPEEELEQRELDQRQLDPLTAANDLVRRLVEDEIRRTARTMSRNGAEQTG